MDNETKAIPLSDLAVDASPIAEYAILLARGALRGLQREQSGIEDVLSEIRFNQTTYGTRAGVLAEDVRFIQVATEHLAEVRGYLRTVRKLLKILESTEAYVDDERHKMISIIAASVEKRAKKAGNENLPARYEKTRAYRSANANKAAKARRRKAKAKAEAQAEAETTAEAAAETPAQAALTG